MKTQTIAILASAALLFVTAPASRAQFITVAPGGPSGYISDAVFGAPFLAPLPAPAPPACPQPGGPTTILCPPPPGNPAAPPGTYIVDALSSGTEAGSIYVFSVTFGAVGLPASAVAFEVGFGAPPSQTIPPGVPGPAAPPEAHGDLFVTAPLAVFGVPGLAVAIPVGSLIGADEFTLGLNVCDDVNALMYRIPGFGVGTAYYSLGFTGVGPGGTGPGPFFPADIIGPGGVPWAGFGALGLLAGDDIDALIIQDFAPGPFYTPGVDFVAFSLTPGSPTLGVIGAGPGDLLVPTPAGLPVVFIPAAAFGLAPGDNLDAIDVIPGGCPNTILTNLTNLTKLVQPPNLYINYGMDVRDTAPKILADDFLCTLTGPITDVHIWGSWTNDYVGTVTNFHISFHADIPVGGTITYSRPGQELWSTNFTAGQFNEQFYTNANEAFYDPNTNMVIGADTMVYRYNFCVDPDQAFVQTNGVIYWLDVQAYTTNGMFGWKSSTEHCHDDAVWGDTPTNTLVWSELRYPTGHPLQGQSFDLAFELTTPIPFNQWQLAYFGCTICPQAAGGADPDGDGMSNTNEYLAGTVPTNSASAFRVVSIVRQNTNDVNLTWTTVGGHSYVVQTNRPPVSGDYTNNFSDLGPVIAVLGVGESPTNQVHIGGATNTPALYYRVRLGPAMCQ